MGVLAGMWIYAGAARGSQGVALGRSEDVPELGWVRGIRGSGIQ